MWNQTNAHPFVNIRSHSFDFWFKSTFLTALFTKDGRCGFCHCTVSIHPDISTLSLHNTIYQMCAHGAHERSSSILDYTELSIKHKFYHNLNWSLICMSRAKKVCLRTRLNRQQLVFNLNKVICISHFMEPQRVFTVAG